MSERSLNSKVVKTIRGLPIPNFPWFTKENIEATMDYTPRDGDIIIASYPKTGTTWLQYIVHQIVSKGQKPPSMEDMTCKVIPFIDKAGIDAIETLTEPRIYKHHFPYNVTQKNPNAKYLYIYRNPEDALVSYYYFMQNLMEEVLDFDAFFEGFMSGNVGYGRYFEHVLSYLALNEDQKLLISYEKLRSNRRDEILRIAKFIGEDYFEDIARDESVLLKILEHTSFDYMKKNLSFIHPKPKADNRILKELNNPKTVNFFRKGEVGDGKKILTSDQLKCLNELMKKLMKGTDIIDEWQSQK